MNKRNLKLYIYQNKTNKYVEKKGKKGKKEKKGRIDT